MVFIVQQYIPDAPHVGEGMIIGVFSTFEKAKAHTGCEDKHWDRDNIDTQNEPESWKCGQWHITMVEVN